MILHKRLTNYSATLLVIKFDSEGSNYKIFLTDPKKFTSFSMNDEENEVNAIDNDFKDKQTQRTKYYYKINLQKTILDETLSEYCLGGTKKHSAYSDCILSAAKHSLGT